MKHIVMSKDNPMNTYLYNYRIEIQSRGAPHIHGVIWLDLDKKLPLGLEKQFDKIGLQKISSR